MSVMNASLKIAEQYGISESSVTRLHKKYLRFMAAQTEKDSVIYDEEQLLHSTLSKPNSKSPTK
jgi:hypothetical protein